MVKKIYLNLTKIYNFIFSLYEFKLLKKKINKEFFKTHLNYLGFEKIKIKNKIIYPKEEKIIDNNKYLKKIIFEYNDILDIIKNIFIKNEICKIISSRTGYNYSVDFFTAYQTLPIEENDIEKGWYANHLHYDAPFTKNVLKLIIPIEKITSNNGPMMILPKNIKNLNKDTANYLNESTCDENEIFFFKPNICLHYASSPKKNQKRSVIMLQLNPSKNWEINENLYKRQFKTEPKFPFFSYFFDKKINLI